MSTTFEIGFGSPHAAGFRPKAECLTLASPWVLV
jgi:hypothetical protein